MGGEWEHTDDKSPSKMSTTEFKVLIENAGAAFHRVQNGCISLRKARGDVTLCACVRRGDHWRLGMNEWVEGDGGPGRACGWSVTKIEIKLTFRRSASARSSSVYSGTYSPSS